MWKSGIPAFTMVVLALALYAGIYAGITSHWIVLVCCFAVILFFVICPEALAPEDDEDHGQNQH